MNSSGEEEEEDVAKISRWKRQSSPSSSLPAQRQKPDEEENDAPLFKDPDKPLEQPDDTGMVDDDVNGINLTNSIQNAIGNYIQSNTKNWIEPTTPFDLSKASGGNEEDDEIIYCNLGVDGKTWATGELAEKMYQATQRSFSFDSPSNTGDSELIAMEFAARVAVGCALLQQGLKMVWNEDEPDGGNWGSIDSIRLLKNDENNDDVVLYDSWKDAVGPWRRGQDFSFVARNVPTQRRPPALD